MSCQEEALTSLYSQRLVLVKQLAEIDTNIKQLEAKLQKDASCFNSPLFDDLDSGDADVEKFRRLIANCTKDVNGLRSALKVVDACKHIQQLMPGTDEMSKAKIHFRNVFVHETIALARRLCMDPNGSELVRHMLPLLTTGSVPTQLHSIGNNEFTSSATTSELMLLIQQLSPDMLTIVSDTNGGRVFQKIVASLMTLEEFSLMARAISDHVVHFAMDINGSHVLAKLIASSQLSEINKEASTSEEKEMLKDIYQCIHQDIAKRCFEICKNRQGCCIVQKSLQWAPEPYYSSIINTVLSNSLELVQDPFGNYVIQFILDCHPDLGKGNPEVNSSDYTNQIIRQMLHHVAELSCNKFSSNVIEKCLKTASPDVRQLLVDELTEPQVLPKLLTDGFANYVIQTAIATASSDGQFTQLRDSIMPLQNLLKHSPYGVKIEAKLSRRNREPSRRQTKKKELLTSTYPTPGTCLEQTLNPPFVSNIPPAMSTLLSKDGTAAVGQAVALTSMSPDVSLFPQHHMMSRMQFVLHGSQQFIGIPGAQPSFINVFGNSSRMNSEYQ